MIKVVIDSDRDKMLALGEKCVVQATETTGGVGSEPGDGEPFAYW